MSRLLASQRKRERGCDAQKSQKRVSGRHGSIVHLSPPKLGRRQRPVAAAANQHRYHLPPRGLREKNAATPFRNIRKERDRYCLEAFARELYSDAANCPPALLPPHESHWKFDGLPDGWQARRVRLSRRRHDSVSEEEDLSQRVQDGLERRMTSMLLWHQRQCAQHPPSLPCRPRSIRHSEAEVAGWLPGRHEVALLARLRSLGPSRCAAGRNP